MRTYNSQVHQSKSRRTAQTQQTLTEAAELADDVGQADIGDTFQLAANFRRDGLATQMPRLDIPRHQRHGGVGGWGGPEPWREREERSVETKI